MSAAELRQAATTLRELSAKASPAPWTLSERQGYHEADDWPLEDAEGQYLGHSPDDGVRAGFEQWDATYIATMHPGVGLALADWLDSVAAGHESIRAGYALNYGEKHADSFMPYIEPHALTIARLINGSS